MIEAEHLFAALLRRKMKMATAESCTGGMVAAAITDIAGSSEIFDRGFVTYSNSAKVELLAIPFNLIAEHGAVSFQVALAMAEGCLLHSAADIAVSVTGIAGPTGGSDLKPVGLVYFAVAQRGKIEWAEQRFGPLSRAEIRLRSTQFALQLILRQLVPAP